MQIRTMKIIDELFGPPLCLFFSFYNALKKPFVKSKIRDYSDVKNILIIKFFGMGSIVLAGPMMRALKERFPGVKIIFLTFSSNREICRRIDLIDEVFCVETKTLMSFFASMLRSISIIRRKRCEISIDLEFFSKFSTLIQYLCGARLRLGYSLIQIGILIRMMWRGNLLTHNIYYNPHRHTSEAFLAFAKSIGSESSDLSPIKIVLLDEDRIRLGKRLSERGIDDYSHLIVVNINSSQLCLERRWPLENFILLANKILEAGLVKMVAIGDSEDLPYVNLFFRQMNGHKRLYNLAGELDIGMLLALLERSALFITNDSGPLHIASCLGIPTVSFFGPEIPERFGPTGQENKHIVFYSRTYCSPCLNVYNQKTAPCNGKNICMQMIAVDDVYRKIKEKYLTIN